MGHVGLKTRSRGQMFEIPRVRSRGHIFSPIIMKLYQHVCLFEILNKFENGSCLVKNLVTSQMLENPCVFSHES